MAVDLTHIKGIRGDWGSSKRDTGEASGTNVPEFRNFRKVCVCVELLFCLS